MNNIVYKGGGHGIFVILIIRMHICINNRSETTTRPVEEGERAHTHTHTLTDRY